MSRAIADRHDHACALAGRAGAAALGFFEQRGALAVETKATAQDVVSHADRAIEALIREEITAAFPDDAILGEEGAPRPGTSGFTWVIDPIDGTMPFLSGLAHWCVAIAVLQSGRTVAAATHAPRLGLIYEAKEGGGFRCNGETRIVSTELGITDAMTAIGASHRTPPAAIGEVITRLLQAGGAYYRSGSGAMMLAEVAAGNLAGYYEPHMHPWDCLGGLLMIREAGGCIAPFDARRMLAQGEPVLVAAPAAFSALSDIVGPASD